MANGNNLDITDLVKFVESQNQGMGAQNQMDAIIALSDMQDNNQQWGSRADQAWFPQGGKLFPKIGGGLQMPEGSGDVMNMLISLITGSQAAKGAQGIMNYVHNMKRAMKPIPKTFANPKGRLPVGHDATLPTPGIPRLQSGLSKTPLSQMINNIVKSTPKKRRGTYTPPPGYKFHVFF